MIIPIMTITPRLLKKALKLNCLYMLIDSIVVLFITQPIFDFVPAPAQ